MITQTKVLGQEHSGRVDRELGSIYSTCLGLESVKDSAGVRFAIETDLL
jgi:hypothetical protein